MEILKLMFMLMTHKAQNHSSNQFSLSLGFLTSNCYLGDIASLATVPFAEKTADVPRQESSEQGTLQKLPTVPLVWFDQPQRSTDRKFIYKPLHHFTSYHLKPKPETV